MDYVQGIELLADFTDDEVSIISARRLRHLPRLVTYRPRLANTERLQAGAAEVALALLAGNGVPVDTAAYDDRATHYVDWLDPKTGAFRGGQRDIAADERDLRTLRVPLPAEGWLLFYRDRAVEIDGEIQLRHEAPVLYDAGDRPGRNLPPSLGPGLPLPSRSIPVPWAAAETVGRSLPSCPAPHDGGRIVSLKKLGRHRPGGMQIVVTGDGFREHELGEFNRLAARIHDGFRRMEPFKSVWTMINWSVVEAVSTDSGIWKCCAEVRTRTFYQTEGRWHHPNAPPTFIGADEQDVTRIEQTGKWAAAGDPIGVVIVIVNCSPYGGHAWPNRPLVFVTASRDRPGLFAGLVAHECAHVIGRLGDEYTCVPPAGVPASSAYVPNVPNVAPLAEVAATVRKRLVERAPGLRRQVSQGNTVRDAVWWQKLAASSELSRDRRLFLAVHVLGDQTRGIVPRVVPYSRVKQLGAFWGGQAVVHGIDEVWRAYCSLLGLPANPKTATGRRLWRELRLPRRSTKRNDVWHEPLGAVFFRPMAVCRMRHVKYQFCRVCCHVLENRIRDLCDHEPRARAAPMSRARKSSRTDER